MYLTRPRDTQSYGTLSKTQTAELEDEHVPNLVEIRVHHRTPLLPSYLCPITKREFH